MEEGRWKMEDGRWRREEGSKKWRWAVIGKRGGWQGQLAGAVGSDRWAVIGGRT